MICSFLKKLPISLVTFTALIVILLISRKTHFLEVFNKKKTMLKFCKKKWSMQLVKKVLKSFLFNFYYYLNSLIIKSIRSILYLIILLIRNLYYLFTKYFELQFCLFKPKEAERLKENLIVLIIPAFFLT